MHKRTYEILAKYIGKKNGIKVVFEPDCEPRADVKNKVITVPPNIKEDCAYGALTTLMHEAAHIRYTDVIPEEFSKIPEDHEITNIIEDVRIDKKNFGILPNIREFYDRYYKKHVEKRNKQDMSKVPMSTKVLINSIFNASGFPEYGIRDDDVQKIDRHYGISNMVSNSTWTIDAHDWKNLRVQIDEIKRKLKIIDSKEKDQQGGQGKQGQGDKPSVRQVGFDEGGDSWGTDNSGSSGSAELGTVGLQELTKAKFKELLNIKEVRIITDGGKIDTDNLTAFLTGDVEELFKEEKSEHKKCSKIMFIIDGSSSMGERLLDGSMRRTTVASACTEIINIIKEVQSLEGLNVDWDISAFNTEYIPLSKENWVNEYMRTGGGTSIDTGFKGAMDKMLNDPTIDGKRIIIMFSDGDVDECEIEEIKKMILRHGEDVRCVVIGVGSDINGEYSKEIIGERNILAQESADIVIMESIMECL